MMLKLCVFLLPQWYFVFTLQPQLFLLLFIQRMKNIQISHLTESNSFPGLANIWLSVEYFRMLLLIFVEPLPLLINEQEFSGVQVRARLSFSVAARVGETRL